MMYYDNYFGGMHFLWWIIWLFLLIWIFAIPYNIPYQRYKKDSPLDILKKRFAKGEISKEEYQEAKKTLKSDT
ncbi:MAG: SHOCT domain-containing protein [Chlorobi bacterium]|nr:SHOCT domain-containing protein [Chlorobiota bacterium]